MLEDVFPLTNRKLGFNTEQIRACWGGFVSWRALCVSLQELLCVLKGALCLGASVSAVCLWVALGPWAGGQSVSLWLGSLYGEVEGGMGESRHSLTLDS